MIYLGIDTSCYTTSIAAIDENGQFIMDKRIPLEVDEGKKGLRQSDMVFKHIRNITEMAERIPGYIAAVAASVAPRPAQDSYMPVFTVSEAVGRMVAAATNSEFYPLTHQHGHIAAAIIGKKLEIEGKLIALHVSGGTTEVLHVVVSDGIVKDIALLGGTKDISCGQLLDRIANQLGLPFPGGPQLEKIATQPEFMRVSVRDLKCNLSGVETALKRLNSFGATPGVIAATAQEAVAATLNKLIENAKAVTGIKRVLAFGGVMCNDYIRSRLAGEGIFFADKIYSSDNACGLASQAARLFNS